MTFEQPTPLPGAPSLRVGVIGAGRVGAVLGAALRKAGHDVVAVSGVSEASRERAEALLPGVPVQQPVGVAAAADLVLLTVPDDELAALVHGLDFPGTLGPRIVVHTSGAQGIGVLAPVVEAGGVPLAIHPAMTFSGTAVDLTRLAGCPFAVTAMPDHRMVADALVLDMGGEPFTVDENSLFVNVGERTNITGSARFRKLIKDGDYATALSADDTAAVAEALELGPLGQQEAQPGGSPARSAADAHVARGARERPGVGAHAPRAVGAAAAAAPELGR